MDSGSNKYQVVFLIDTSLSTCVKCSHINEVLLTVFRLLSLLEESCRKATAKIRHEKKRRAVDKQGRFKSVEVDFKWGFKFFNTVTTLPRNKLDNPKFRSFQLPQIEDFEKKVKNVFASVSEDKTKRKSLSHPAELLSTALTEIYHDFSWDESDIFSSPVTRRQGQKSEDNASRNFVFLLAKAPLSKKSLRQFSNKMVIDSDVFIDSFLSPTLLNEYQKKLNLSLNWVDLSSSSCGVSGFAQTQMDQATPEAVAILQDTCKKLGGHFLMKDLIFSYMVSREAVTTLDNRLTEPLHLLSAFSEESRLSNFVSVQDGPGTGGKVTASFTFHDVQDMQIQLLLVKKLEGQRNISSNALSKKCMKTDTEVNDSKDPGHQSLDELMFFHLNEAQFTLLGYVPQVEVCDLLMKYSSHSYLLDSKKSEHGLSSFLQHLAASEIIGIFSVKLKQRPHGTLAVLQAHPGSLGFITILNVGGTFQVEKALRRHSDVIRDTESENSERNSEDEKPSFMEKLQIDIENLKKLDKSSRVCEKSVEQQNMFQSHCMNSWHVPGTSSSLGPLLMKIDARLEDKDTICNTERDILKELQKFYSKEKQPKEVVQNLQPSTSTPMCALKNIRTGSSGGSESGSRSSPRKLSRHPSSTLSRGRLMVDRARSASHVVPEDGNSSHSSKSGTLMKRTSSSFGILDLDLNSEDDLEAYLLKQYEQVLSAGVAVETTIRTMVTVTSRFMVNKQLSNPTKSAANFIHKHLIVTAGKLKEKYNKVRSSAEDIKTKVAEYKIQVTLLLEIESLAYEHDLECQEKVVNELVSMLRALSFLIGATGLQLFLTDVLVTSYSGTMSKILVDVYDELMLPLPPALAKFASPAAPSSVWAPPSVTNDNSLLSGPGSSQPASEQSSQREKRSRKLQQHPSISDFRQKRQILVKAKPKPKTEPKKTTKDKSKDKVKPRVRSSRTRYGVDCGSAKRNLFTDKPKTATGKQKETPSKRRTKKHRHRVNSGSEKSRTLVIGTPAHKQTSQRHLQRQQRRRQHDNIQPEIQVVAESPVKDDDEVVPKSQMNKPARYLVREAFYSSNSQPSRNLARSLEQVQKGYADPNLFPKYKSQTSKQGTLSSAVRGESPMLSPRSRLIKSFMSSPSPTPKSKARDRSSTPVSMRRSPRKSVKRLDFKTNKSPNRISPSRPNPLDAHLIFDGENANDFHILKSPLKFISTSSVTEGYKTPEKQKIPKPQMFENASCPPVMATPPKNLQDNISPALSFRNILSQGGNQRNTYGSPKARTSRESRSQTIGESPMKGRSMGFERRTPEKSLHEPQMFSSPDQATRLRSSLFSKSPRKAIAASSPSKTPTKSVSSKATTASQSQIQHSRKISSSGIEPVSTPTKGKRVPNGNSEANSDVIFSTPRKLFSQERSNVSQNIHLTPSKVKFDAHLISPPSGCGYPPSAEKSTPGRSILKSSPSIKRRVVRRVELQSVAGPSSLSPSSFGSALKASESHSRSPRKPSQRFSSPHQHLSPSVENTMQENICKAESDSAVKNQKEILESNSKDNKGSSQQTVSADVSVSSRQTTAKSKNYNTNVSTQRRKRQRDEVDSPSSGDTSDEECPRGGDAPASITIRTPSPSSKTKIDSIDKWARRKRSSSKNGSSSSSNSILSPTSSSSSNEEKIKTPSRVESEEIGKENSSKKVVEELRKSPSGKGKQIRKRSLFTVDDTAGTCSPSKRMKTLCEQKPEQHIISNTSLDRVDTEIFEQGHSPELIPFEGEDIFLPNSGRSVYVHSAQNDSNYSQSSQDSTHVSPSSTQNKSLVGQNSALSSQQDSSQTYPSLLRQFTHQSSSLLEEGSQGFQTQLISSTKPQSEREARNSSRHQPSPSKSRPSHSVNPEIHSKNITKQDSNDYANDLKQAAKSKSTILTEDRQSMNSNKSIPQSSHQQSNLPKRISSASSNSGGSPCHSESKSPEKQQYSPSLSATGLLHLIKSPLLSPRSRRRAGQDQNDQKRTTRSKSRKHLDI